VACSTKLSFAYISRSLLLLALRNNTFFSSISAPLLYCVTHLQPTQTLYNQSGYSIMASTHNRGGRWSNSLLSYFFYQATDSRINYVTAVHRGLIYLLTQKGNSLGPLGAPILFSSHNSQATASAPQCSLRQALASTRLLEAMAARRVRPPPSNLRLKRRHTF